MKKLLTALPATLFATLALADWQPLPADNSFWQHLLHLGANFYDDYLYAVDNTTTIGVDHLAPFGGDASQNPHPGLVFHGLTGPGNGQTCDLAWTAMDNPTPVVYPDYDNSKRWVWTTAVPGDNNGKNNYIKYWHANIFSPASSNRAARLHYRVDDDLRVWNNGELILEHIGWDNNNAGLNVPFTLTNGLNRITIKLREGTGGDHMGVRVTDPGNNPFDDLLYSLRDVATPPVISVTHDTVTLGTAYSGLPNEPFTLVAVCDLEDRGPLLTNWLASATCKSNAFANILSAPSDAAITGLDPGTPHFARLFVLPGGADMTELSEPAPFTTFDHLPVVEALPATSVGGLAATANARLLWQGSDSATADLILFWGTADGGDEPGDWIALNPQYAPVTNKNQTAGNSVIPFPLTDAEGLWYSTDYLFRVLAVNNDGQSWSDDTIAFKTLGEPWFDSVSFATPAPGSLDLIANIGSCGAVAATITCWFGTDPENLSITNTWTRSGATTVTHTETGLQLGAAFYYAFRVECVVDSSTGWTVWSDTNLCFSTGASTWIDEGANTDWRTAANWNNGVPGPNASANFHYPGATVTALQDLNVAEAMVNAAGTVTFALADKTLHVRDRFDVGGNALPDYPANGGAILKITGGTVDVGAQNLTIGDGANDNALHLEGAGAVVANELTIGRSPNDTNRGQRNKLIVTGPDTRLQANTLRVADSSKAHDNSFLLQNAAMDVTNFIVGGGTESNNAKAVLDNAEARIQTLTIGVGWHPNNSELHLLDSSVTVSQNIDLGCVDASNARMVVSNSTVTVNNDFRHGLNNGAARDAELIILQTPGPAFTSRVSVANNYTLGNDAQSHRVINTGGVLSIGGNLSLNPGGGWYSGVTVTNGVLDVAGSTLLGASPNARYNFLRLAGPAALFRSASLSLGAAGGHYFHLDGATAEIANAVTINSNTYTNRVIVGASAGRLDAASLSAGANTLFVFTLPEGGFVSTNGVPRAALHFHENAALDAAAQIEIHLGAFIGAATLIESATGNLDELPLSNITVTQKPGNHHKLLIDANRLAIKAWKNGTLLLVK